MRIQTPTGESVFEKDSLKHFFVRGVEIQTRPVGRVYFKKEKGSGGGEQEEGGEWKAEIEECYVIKLHEPITDQTVDVILDPRHPQFRDQLKIAQNVLEGRAGGNAPVLLRIEETTALDPDGKPIEGTLENRVAEMADPTPRRGEFPIFDGDVKIGEWTPALETEFDRALDAEITSRFGGFMNDLAKDPEGGRWAVVQARGEELFRKMMTQQGMSPEEIDKELSRHRGPREGFLRGEHQDPANPLNVRQTAFDVTDGRPPNHVGARLSYCTQRAALDVFAQEMGAIPTGENGETAPVTSLLEGEMVRAGVIAAPHPGRDPEVTKLRIKEKSLILGQHLLAGGLRAAGAEAFTPRLREQLDDKNWLHSDLSAVLESAGVPEADRAKEYFTVAEARGKFYVADRSRAVEAEAQKSMKFPEKKRTSLDGVAKRAAAASASIANGVEKGLKEVEGVSWGL